jgi:hypothetical protein
VRLIDLKIKFLTTIFLAQLKVPEPEIFELMFYTIKAYPINRDWKKILYLIFGLKFTILWAKIPENVCECVACYPLTHFLTFRQPKNKFCFRFLEKHMKLSLCSEHTLTSFVCKLITSSGMEECKIPAWRETKCSGTNTGLFHSQNRNFPEESFMFD